MVWYSVGTAGATPTTMAVVWLLVVVVGTTWAAGLDFNINEKLKARPRDEGRPNITVSIRIQTNQRSHN